MIVNMFMNKLYLLLILGMSVLLLGCTQPPAEPAAPTIQYVCANGTVVTDQTLCPVAGAAEADLLPLTREQELEVCVGMPAMPQGSLEDMCIVGIAGKYEDTSLCKKISSDQRFSCYAIVAGVKNDPDGCLEAEYQEDKCYDAYAQNKRDASVCGKIKDINSKDNCYSRLAGQIGDATLCDKIQNVNQKDNCYREMAQRFNDPSYCENITNSDQKQNCLNSVQSKG